MKGIPKKDGWYVMREDGQPMECVKLYTGKATGQRFVITSGQPGETFDVEDARFANADFFPIPPPPDDGEYACVWVEVQRDKPICACGKGCPARFGNGCLAPSWCPLGSD